MAREDMERMTWPLSRKMRYAAAQVGEKGFTSVLFVITYGVVMGVVGYAFIWTNINIFPREHPGLLVIGVLMIGGLILGLVGGVLMLVLALLILICSLPVLLVEGLIELVTR